MVFTLVIHRKHEKKKKRTSALKGEFSPHLYYFTNASQIQWSPSEGSRDFYLPVSQLKKYFLSLDFYWRYFTLRVFISFLESSLIFFFQLSCRICRHSQCLLCQSDWFSSQLLLLLVNNLHEIFSWRLFLTEESNALFPHLEIGWGFAGESRKTTVGDIKDTGNRPLNLGAWAAALPSCLLESSETLLPSSL